MTLGHAMTHMNVIVTSSRFGGRYLLKTLSRCRPDFIILHEVLRKETDSHRTLSDMTGLSVDKLKAMAASEPEMLWTVIADSAKASGRNIAMLVYYYHQPRISALWDRIHQGARIVHLVRRNLFEAFLSRQTALQSNIWRPNADYDSRSERPIVLNEKDLRSYISERTRDIAWARRTFASGDYHEIFFEDITRTAGVCLDAVNRLFPANGEIIPPVCLTPPSRRLLSNADRVANYAFVAKFDREYSL